MGRIWLAGVLGCLAVWPAAARADSTTEPVEVGRVLVSPRRIPGLAVDAFSYPGSATVISREDIAASGAATVQDVIAKTDSVTLTDQQGFGLASDGTVNLRGIINSSRTNALVLVDGIRQNRLTGDEVHWQSIPLGEIERIEIIRGGTCTIH